MKKNKFNFEELLKLMDEAARKVHKSNAKHQIVKRVYDPKTGKYIKTKRFKTKNHMTRKEEREFFGHGFGPLEKKSLYINIKEGATLFFDKNNGLCDVVPDSFRDILSDYRGVPYGILKLQFENG